MGELYMEYIRLIIIAVASGIAAYSDYKIRKIKNKLTISLALLGLLINLITKDIGIGQAILGFFSAFIICLPFYLLKMLRAGDIKLFMAIGAMLGFTGLIDIMAKSILCGAIIALVIGIKQRKLLKRFQYLWYYLKNIFYTRKISAYITEDKQSDGYFPFGIAIFFGVFLEIAIKFLRLGGI